MEQWFRARVCIRREPFNPWPSVRYRVAVGRVLGCAATAFWICIVLSRARSPQQCRGFSTDVLQRDIPADCAVIPGFSPFSMGNAPGSIGGKASPIAPYDPRDCCNRNSGRHCNPDRFGAGSIRPPREFESFASAASAARCVLADWVSDLKRNRAAPARLDCLVLAADRKTKV